MYVQLKTFKISDEKALNEYLKANADKILPGSMGVRIWEDNVTIHTQYTEKFDMGVEVVNKIISENTNNLIASESERIKIESELAILNARQETDKNAKSSLEKAKKEVNGRLLGVRLGIAQIKKDLAHYTDVKQKLVNGEIDF